MLSGTEMERERENRTSHHLSSCNGQWWPMFVFVLANSLAVSERMHCSASRCTLPGIPGGDLNANRIPTERFHCLWHVSGLLTIETYLSGVRKPDNVSSRHKACCVMRKGGCYAHFSIAWRNKLSCSYLPTNTVLLLSIWSEAWPEIGKVW